MRRAPRMSPDARRGHILDAARECFARKGYHQSTIDDIAEQAGLSKGAVYWHFSSKRDLFLALLDAMLTLDPEVLAPDETVPPLAALQHMAEAALEMAAPSLGTAELFVEYLAHSARDEEVRTALRDKGWVLVQAAAVQIERGVKSGVFRPVDPDAAALAFFAPVDGLMLHKLVRPELDFEAAWRTSVELFLRGLAQ